MWRDGQWISDDETMTATEHPAAQSTPADDLTPAVLREAAQALRATAEVAQDDPEYRETLGLTHREPDRLTGSALTLESLAGQV